MTRKTLTVTGLTALCLAVGASLALGHGDVTPQPVDTAGLPVIEGGWALENPYRNVDETVWARAVRIGASGYNQNCARCHGLEAVSGGLAPDLRYLEADDFGDEWYMERVRNGVTLNNITRMPAYENLLSQEAMWAIRTYIETRPDDTVLAAHLDRLRAVRDRLREIQAALGEGAANPDDQAAELTALQDELHDIASRITTLSGAPVADSIAYQAALALERGGERAVRDAAETLTIGLSAAR